MNIDAKAEAKARELADHCRYCAKDRPRCADDYERQVRDIAAELQARDGMIDSRDRRINVLLRVNTRLEAENAELRQRCEQADGGDK